MRQPGGRGQKQRDIDEVVALLRQLSPIQVGIIESIIERFAEGVEGELLRTDFLNEEAFEFFGVRLSAHHAYSSQKLKKENFEHILEQSFNRAGIEAVPSNSMTLRGADLVAGGVALSLKTEASRNLKANVITISKLMEAAWIKTIQNRGDIPPNIQAMVMPHFDNYERVFILRAYEESAGSNIVRYDLREIPLAILRAVGDLGADDFTPLTRTRTTSASVRFQGRPAFTFRLDGSDDKLTITNLDASICPLHAWWRLDAPG